MRRASDCHSETDGGCAMPLLLENRVLRNERVVLDKPNLNALGAGLVLHDCEVDIRVPAGRLSIDSVVFDQCVIRTKSPLVNFQGWLGNSIRRTRFFGIYKGNDFGVVDWTRTPGVSEELDFSAATLDMCAVQGCSVDSFTWPSWPCFTVLDPAEHLRKLSPPFDGTFHELAEAPPNLSALCFHAPRVLRDLVDQGATVEALRRALPQAHWLRGL